MKILVYILVLFITNSAIAKEKTVKFHKPQTEAERALDEILRVENGLENGKKNIRNAVLTSGFLKEESLQAKYYNDCSKGKVWCKNNISELFRVINHIHSGRYPYSYHDIFYKSQEGKSDTVYLDVYYKYKDSEYDNTTKELFIGDAEIQNNVHYVMKKEDGKWKIDGICATGGNLHINHHHCYYQAVIDYLDIESEIGNISM